MGEDPTNIVTPWTLFSILSLFCRVSGHETKHPTLHGSLKSANEVQTGQRGRDLTRITINGRSILPSHLITPLEHFANRPLFKNSLRH